MVQTQESPHRPQSVYQVQLREEVTITTRQLATRGPNQILIDTRSTLEWLTGHLSGAVHLPWTTLYEGKDRHPIDAATYSRLLVKRNIKKTDELIFYCTGGVRSAYAWVIHQLDRPSPARNYEGGTEAWERLGTR
jgi:thiosulfate/3-mercaptopyruvate sulfurtransferase